MRGTVLGVFLKQSLFLFERLRYRCFIFLHKMKQLCRVLRAAHVGNSSEPGILSAMQCYDASIPYKEVGRLLSHYSARKMITASLGLPCLLIYK